MLNELAEIKSITLEISDDHRRYSPFFEYCSPALIKAAGANYSLLAMIDDLIASGEYMETANPKSTFRIRIASGRRDLFIYSQSKKKPEKVFHPDKKIFSDNEYSKYRSLTKTECMYLNFFYHGYKDDSISEIFKISTETLRVHRRNIYTKMGFHDRMAMGLWAERHLYFFMRREDLPAKHLIK